MNISWKIMKPNSISIILIILLLNGCGWLGSGGEIDITATGIEIKEGIPLAAGICEAHKYTNIESGAVIYCKSEDSTPGLTEWTYEGKYSWFCDQVLTQCALE